MFKGEYKRGDLVKWSPESKKLSVPRQGYGIVLDVGYLIKVFWFDRNEEFWTHHTYVQKTS